MTPSRLVSPDPVALPEPGCQKLPPSLTECKLFFFPRSILHMKFGVPWFFFAAFSISVFFLPFVIRSPFPPPPSSPPSIHGLAVVGLFISTFRMMSMAIKSAAAFPQFFLAFWLTGFVGIGLSFIFHIFLNGRLLRGIHSRTKLRSPPY